jgi:DNA-binding response OmpR family regulator
MHQKVLIVEDDLSINTSLQFLMNQCGYEALTATNGEDAIEAVMKYLPDLILLDVMLPGINGYEVCEIIRLNPKWQKTRIIFLTALGDSENIAKAMVLGADDYISKPFSNNTVKEKVKKLLEDSIYYALPERTLKSMP